MQPRLAKHAAMPYKPGQGLAIGVVDRKGAMVGNVHGLCQQASKEHLVLRSAEVTT